MNYIINNIQPIVKPQDNDILCGVCKNSYNHPGNKYYRELIKINKVRMASQNHPIVLSLYIDIVDPLSYSCILLLDKLCITILSNIKKRNSATNHRQNLHS